MNFGTMVYGFRNGHNPRHFSTMPDTSDLHVFFLGDCMLNIPAAIPKNLMLSYYKYPVLSDEYGILLYLCILVRFKGTSVGDIKVRSAIRVSSRQL